MYNPLLGEEQALAGIIGNQGGPLPIILEHGGVVRITCPRDTNQQVLRNKILKEDGALLLRGHLKKYVDASVVSVGVNHDVTLAGQIFPGVLVVNEYLLLYRY